MPAAYKTALQKLRREAGYKSAAAYADHMGYPRPSRNVSYFRVIMAHFHARGKLHGAIWRKKKFIPVWENFFHFPIALLFLFGYKLTNG